MPEEKRAKLPPAAPPPRAAGGPSPKDPAAVTRAGAPSPAASAGAPVRSGPPPLPMPTPEGFMSTAAKLSLADIALSLRDEQLEAKVVHYRSDLATNAELDAITAQVLVELQSLQGAARPGGAKGGMIPADRAEVEIELIQSLKEMLARIFRPNKLATLIQRKLAEVSKRFARLFFESELADRIRGSNDELKAMRYPDQAMYHAFVRVQDTVFRHLASFQYSEAGIKEKAAEQYLAMVKGLRNDFLARTTPELNVLVKYLNEVLTKFFMIELPPALGELSWEVVREARLGEARVVAGYKISADAFPMFRHAFERKFLQRLVPFVADEMLNRVRRGGGEFRSETIRLVADPAIFSELCEVVCDAIYDMLYNDGFLDLPSDWRARLSAGG